MREGEGTRTEEAIAEELSNTSLLKAKPCSN